MRSDPFLHAWTKRVSYHSREREEERGKKRAIGRSGSQSEIYHLEFASCCDKGKTRHPIPLSFAVTVKITL